MGENAQGFSLVVFTLKFADVIFCLGRLSQKQHSRFLYCPFKMVITDYHMPQMDGFAVIERVRQNQPDIAVVIMTGFGTLETAMRALQQGALEFLNSLSKG